MIGICKLEILMWTGILTEAETIEGRKYDDQIKSPEMEQIIKVFKRTHAMSIHLNAIALIGSIGYGILLGAKLGIWEGDLEA